MSGRFLRDSIRSEFMDCTIECWWFCTDFIAATSHSAHIVLFVVLSVASSSGLTHVVCRLDNRSQLQPVRGWGLLDCIRSRRTAMFWRECILYACALSIAASLPATVMCAVLYWQIAACLHSCCARIVTSNQQRPNADDVVCRRDYSSQLQPV